MKSLAAYSCNLVLFEKSGRSRGVVLARTEGGCIGVRMKS